MTWETWQQIVRYSFAIVGTIFAVRGYPNEIVQMITGSLGPLVALVWWQYWERHRND